jgi:Fe-S cluster assembly protein SufD
MAAVAERHEHLAVAFDEARPSFTAASLPARQRAFDRFLAQGFPTPRDEEWKFTSVAPIAATTFRRAQRPSIDAPAVAPFRLAGVAADIVLVNGRFAAAVSDLSRLPSSVSVETGDSADGLEPTEGTSVFVDLNTAFHEDAVRLRIAPKAVITEPIHVVSIAVGDGSAQLLTPRVVIDVGEAAQAVVIESHVGLGAGPTLSSAVARITLEPHAILEHVKIQRESAEAFHLAHLHVRLARSSTFRSTALTFGGRIARNDIVARLDGEGAECTLNGLYVATAQQLVDTHTTIDHAQPHCPSHELYKGILGGRARAVFNGKIIVRPLAQKTDAKQTNKALLLSDDAQVNTKPQLEIFADDVKCTHGAAIGQLDDDAMFYLRARGIAESEARAMLVHAFAGEVLDGISAAPAREAAYALLDAKLTGAP